MMSLLCQGSSADNSAITPPASKMFLEAFDLFMSASLIYDIQLNLL
jgi:hypothetical protein